MSFLKRLVGREPSQRSLVEHNSTKSYLRLGSTGRDWGKEQRDAWANGVVASVLSTILDKIAQSGPIGVRPDAKGNMVEEEATTKAVYDALDLSPVGADSFFDILAFSLKVFGMAYIIRNKESNVIAPFMSNQVERDVIAGRLRYKVRLHGGGTTDKYFDPEDVWPVKYGMPDPRNPLVYISPLIACVREIVGENETTNFMASVLYNMGMPGLIVSPEQPIKDEGAAKKWTTKVREALTRYTRDARGEPYVAPDPVKIQTVSFAPNQMNLDALDRLFITKICSALGVDPMAVGLPSDNRTYNNYAEARKALIEDTVLPLWDVMLPPLEKALRESGYLRATMRGVHLAVNRKAYRELEDDRFKVSTDVQAIFKAGVSTRGEARQALGFKTDTTDSRTFFDMMAESRGGAVRTRFTAEERRKIEKLHETTS